MWRENLHRPCRRDGPVRDGPPSILSSSGNAGNGKRTLRPVGEAQVLSTSALPEVCFNLGMNEMNPVPGMLGIGSKRRASRANEAVQAEQRQIVGGLAEHCQIGHYFAHNAGEFEAVAREARCQGYLRVVWMQVDYEMPVR